MKYNFDTIIDRTDTCCYKYDQRKEVFGREDVIPMWIADMDFAVGPFITEAILERANCPLYGYEFRGECYHNAIVEWIQRRNGWKIEKEWIEFTPGVVAGLVFGVRAFSGAGRGVTIQPPVYPPFAHVIETNQRVIMNNSLKVENDTFVIDFEDLDRKLAGSDTLMFCNPHNPTGRVFTRAELEKVAELCIKHDIIVISDEIHSDLVQKPYRHTHIASLSPEMARRTITLLAPSKTFNIAGLSTSIAVIPDSGLMERFRSEIDKAHVGSGNIFGKIAAVAAYTHGDEWLDELMEYLAGNIKMAKDFLAEKMPAVKCHNCGGTFLLWLDFRSWGLSGKKLKDFMINKAGLGLNDGREFGAEGTGFMRMNIATSRAVVKKALDQLYEAAKEEGFI